MKTEKKQQVAHLIAGFILLLQGFDWFEKGLSISQSLYLLLASTFLLVAGLHKWMQRTFQNSDTAFFLIEAAALFYSAVIAREEDSKWLWILIGGIGVIYVGFAIATIISNIDSTRERRRRKRKKIRSTSRTI